jgi:phosphoglucosamine mutase
MALRFGTDGLRGVANLDLTAEAALALGRAASRVLGPSFVVGRDTRRSGTLLEAAFAAGVAAEGGEAVLLGVLPTPGVAYVAQARNVAAAMVSASHNPFPDNGIKLFAPGGRKLPDDVEAEVEAALHDLLGGSHPGPTGADVGAVVVDHGANDGYLDHLAGALEGRALAGLRVVIDCANGAASADAPSVLRRLGAEVHVLHAEPDGVNINAACGATHPEDLAATVVALGADAGLAFDGDADRCIAVDHTGAVVDGDHVIAIAALDLQARGRRTGGTVVTTVMANLGFRNAMRAAGIEVVETPVGDRYVLEALDAGGLSLGGEQSGHVIYRDLATTGDGVLTGLLLLDVVRRSGMALAGLAAAAMTRLPQVLVNVRLPQRNPQLLADLAPVLDAASEELGDRGRVLVRASGTEPLIRVMVEAPTHDEASELASRLADLVRLAAHP